MTKYDLNKVLEGVRPLVHHDLWRDDWDPTRSLDDALPLIEEYKICLYSPGCSYAGGEYGWRDDAWGAEMCEAAYYALDEDFRYDVLCSRRRFEADAAPLAICLCALSASGRNPKDFEVQE